MDRPSIFLHPKPSSSHYPSLSLSHPFSKPQRQKHWNQRARYLILGCHASFSFSFPFFFSSIPIPFHSILDPVRYIGAFKPRQGINLLGHASQRPHSAVQRTKTENVVLLSQRGFWGVVGGWASTLLVSWCCGGGVIVVIQIPSLQ